MRKARQKIAPNLVSAARSSKIQVMAFNEDAVVPESPVSNVEMTQDPIVSSENQTSISVIEPGPSFSRYKPKKRIEPTTCNAPHPGRTFSSASESEVEEAKKGSRTVQTGLDKLSAKKDNVDTTPKTSAQKGKSLNKKSDESPLEVKKKKPGSGKVIDHSKLMMRDFIHYNPANGYGLLSASVKIEEEGESAAMPAVLEDNPKDEDELLDEKSLDTGETPNSKRKSDMVNYGSWRKRRRSGKWSQKETARFFIGLQMLGTDFSLMEPYFPGRDRVHLKNKYKKEEKENKAFVDQYLYNPKPFDATLFIDSEDSSGELEDTTPKKKAKESRVSTGRKTTTGSRSGRKKPQTIDSDVEQGNISKNERGKLTVVEEPGRVQPSNTSASKMVISTSKAASID